MYILTITLWLTVLSTQWVVGVFCCTRQHILLWEDFLLAFWWTVTVISNVVLCSLMSWGIYRVSGCCFSFHILGFLVVFLLYLELRVEGVTFTYPADFLHNHEVSAASSFLCFMPWTRESHHPAEEDASFTCVTDNNYPSHNHSQCQLLVLFLVSWLELNPLEEGAAFVHTAYFLHDHAQ